MRSVTLITLLAFAAQAHSEEFAADDAEESDDSVDNFADTLMDNLADKLFDFGMDEYDQDTAYTPYAVTDDQLDEDELEEADDEQIDEDELASVLGLR